MNVSHNSMVINCVNHDEVKLCHRKSDKNKCDHTKPLVTRNKKQDYIQVRS